MPSMRASEPHQNYLAAAQRSCLSKESVMDLANHVAHAHTKIHHQLQQQVNAATAVPLVSTYPVLQDIWSLINATHCDPLAPFSMAAGRQYVFSTDGSAVLSYCVCAGWAVVAGDPIGNPDRYIEVLEMFAKQCQEHHWRIAALGVSNRRLALWHRARGLGEHLAALPIGRDVVLDVHRFSLAGRGKRNLRQAVQRTRNAGVTTQIVAEPNIDEHLRAELFEVMANSGRDVDVERGFSMMLGSTLSGRYPGVWLIIARDRAGQAQGFHRYTTAGGGTDLSLDLPWRRQNALNGIDERLSIDMLHWAKEHGGERVSLAFAPFPELFSGAEGSGSQHELLRALAHLGDRFIKLESLYRYLRKFDAMDSQRFAVFPRTHAVQALIVLLRLEFTPRRSSHDGTSVARRPTSAPQVINSEHEINRETT